MVEKKNPFLYSKSILQKNYIDDPSGFVPFLMVKLFSASMNHVLLANAANHLGCGHVAKGALYDFYYYAVPQSSKWLKYPKKEAEIKKVKYLMEYYSVSERTAKDYLQILPNEDVKEITNYFEKRGETK